MGVKTTTHRQITCDSCRKAIAYPEYPQVVRLGDYGLTLHVACFATMTGPELLELMGEEAVVYTLINENGETNPESIRVRKPTGISADGRITGGEIVEWPF